jgi:hypothetical protein
VHAISEQAKPSTSPSVSMRHRRSR